MNYLEKLKGEKEALPKKSSIKDIIFAFFGGFIAISAVALLTSSLESMLILGSFGATCVLLFAFPKSPFSQPRNILFGHFISTFVGLFFFHFLGDAWYSIALALASAIALMLLTRTVHPPAGSNPLIVFLSVANWDFLFFPTFFGALIVIAMGILYNNLHPKRVYPSYWF